MDLNIYVTHDKYATLRVNVDYGEEVHWLRILGEWSNMIGYKVGSSPARVYTMAKTSHVENFNGEWMNDVAPNIATPFARGVLWRLSFLDNLKPLDKKLGLQRTPYIVFPSCPLYQSLPQMTLSWTKNSWLIDALLHRSLNQSKKWNSREVTP